MGGSHINNNIVDIVLLGLLPTSLHAARFLTVACSSASALCCSRSSAGVHAGGALVKQMLQATVMGLGWLLGRPPLSGAAEMQRDQLSGTARTPTCAGAHEGRFIGWQVAHCLTEEALVRTAVRECVACHACWTTAAQCSAVRCGVMAAQQSTAAERSPPGPSQGPPTLIAVPPLVGRLPTAPAGSRLTANRYGVVAA